MDPSFDRPCSVWGIGTFKVITLPIPNTLPKIKPLLISVTEMKRLSYSQSFSFHKINKIVSTRNIVSILQNSDSRKNLKKSLCLTSSGMMIDDTMLDNTISPC